MSSLLYDHISAQLSELDMMMIKSIPPGGNWRDIPLNIAKKSARLMQIRRSGGRTTYYGRLNEDSPSYTINTYFNRPGNGTFIHPKQDRLISLREAARLQSFPDEYRFHGSISSRFKQIGNAVPPLLARALGSMVPAGRVIDLFAGAGGLSKGLEMAGHNVILASDINQHMCMTLRQNHPETQVLQGDLSTEDQCKQLVDTAESLLNGKTLRMIVGGPPCQGFSTAGKWTPDDERNYLFIPMMRVIDRLRPEFVLIENVPGILWMKNGLVFEKILAELEYLGYKARWNELRAEEFGVPQRRRRVFIFASQDNPIAFPEPIFAPAPDRRNRESGWYNRFSRPKPITVGKAISDLPPISAGSGAEVTKYSNEWIESKYQEWARGLIPLNELLTERT